MTGTVKKLYYCNFCGKNQEQAKHIIAANGVCICDECVLLCVQVLLDSKPSTTPSDAA